MKLLDESQSPGHKLSFELTLLQAFEHFSEFSAVRFLTYTMPYISQRKRLVQDLEEFVVGRKLIKLCTVVPDSEEDSAAEDDMLDQPLTALHIVQSTRYLQRNAVPKSREFTLKRSTQCRLTGNHLHYCKKMNVLINVFLV